MSIPLAIFFCLPLDTRPVAWHNRDMALLTITIDLGDIDPQTLAGSDPVEAAWDVLTDDVRAQTDLDKEHHPVLVAATFTQPG